MSKSRKIKIGIAAGIIVILAVAMIMTKGGKKSKGGMPVGQEASIPHNNRAIIVPTFSKVGFFFIFYLLTNENSFFLLLFRPL